MQTRVKDIFYNIDSYSIDNEHVNYNINLLLEHRIMFSDSLDLAKIRLYLNMDYTLIFKYRNSFAKVFLIPVGDSWIEMYCNTKFEEAFKKLEICQLSDKATFFNSYYPNPFFICICQFPLTNNYFLDQQRLIK